MRHFKQGPVIRQDEQLIVIVEQKLVNEAKYKKLDQPRIWKGALEVERREFQTYADIANFVLDNPDCSLITALRVCVSDGSIEDITSDVVEATHEQQFASGYTGRVYSATREHGTLSHRVQGVGL